MPVDKGIASFDPGHNTWIAGPGTYTVKTGTSSENIRAEAAFTLEKEIVVEKVRLVLSPGRKIDEMVPASAK